MAGGFGVGVGGAKPPLPPHHRQQTPIQPPSAYPCPVGEVILCVACGAMPGSNRRCIVILAAPRQGGIRWDGARWNGERATQPRLWPGLIGFTGLTGVRLWVWGKGEGGASPPPRIASRCNGLWVGASPSPTAPHPTPPFPLDGRGFWCGGWGGEAPPPPTPSPTNPHPTPLRLPLPRWGGEAPPPQRPSKGRGNAF